ncbi:hypothetical protein [Rhizobium sp. LjRoot258]|uniref:hypothetical protein n=1 Tax=Rhizobium sp. LjRoot258 TaxID=3342299 RepID=UPI003ECFBEDC
MIKQLGDKHWLLKAVLRRSLLFLIGPARFNGNNLKNARVFKFPNARYAALGNKRFVASPAFFRQMAGVEPLDAFAMHRRLNAILLPNPVDSPFNEQNPRFS